MANNAGPFDYLAGSVPATYLQVSQSTADFEFSYENSTPGILAVITSIDAVAQGSSPVQCFCQFLIEPNIGFFYQSQSVGEGLGVYFSWRGWLPLYYLKSVGVKATSAAAEIWSCTISGLSVPWMNSTGPPP